MGAAYWRSLFFVPPATSPPDSPLRFCGYTFIYPRHREELHPTATLIRNYALCNSVAIYLCLGSTLIRTIALRNEVYSAVDAHVGAW